MIQIVEQPPLVEEWAIGGVEIFGLHIAQRAAAKADHPSACVADREHQPATEAVVGVALIGLADQAGFQQLVGGRVLQMAAQRGARIGGIAQRERLQRGRAHAAPFQIGARTGPAFTGQLRLEPGGGPAGEFGQAVRHFGFRPRFRGGGGHFQPGFGGQLLHRLHERQAHIVGHEADHIAVRTAAKAVIEALFIVDVETGGFLVVEGAAALHLPPRPGQLHAPPDDARSRNTGA